MASWNWIIVVGVAFACAAYFKLAFSLADRNRGDGSFDEMDARVGRLKRSRAERGECIYCGAPLGGVAPTLTQSVCAQCAPAFVA